MSAPTPTRVSYHHNNINMNDMISRDNEVSPVVVIEEIEEDDNVSMITHAPISPSQQLLDTPQSVSSGKQSREFGNISPISELLCDDDVEDEDNEQIVEIDEDDDNEVPTGANGNDGKITPEPGPYPAGRLSFPRISDGRSSPILAYSPSLVKSPSSNNSGKLRNLGVALGSTSPTSSGGATRRTRNIARILDNISDHSSGEDDVNNVNLMMSKFTV